MFTALFGLFATIAFGAPFWAYLVGFLCIFVIPPGALALYGLTLTFVYSGPVWAYVVGILCIALDTVLVAESLNRRFLQRV